MARLWTWVNERLPVDDAVRRFLDEDIPGGSSFAYALGSATILAFLILGITGIFQVLYYVPTVDHAYDSVNFLRFEVPFGWLIHGLHFWSATAMVVLVLLHLARVFFFGAFKRPRELTWLLGVGLLLATLAAAFTGGPLPWDEKGYWAAQVGGSIAGTIPLVGNFIKQVFWGGEAAGQVTLSRFFTMHTAIVPIILVVLIGLHVAALRSQGAAGAFRQKAKDEVGRFWPEQVHKDALVAAAVFVLLVGLSAFLLTPVNGPADPIDATYVAKPDWTFLFFYQSLKLFPGALEPVGTVGVPLVGLALLLLVPWLDRGPERHPLRRPVATAAFLVVAAGVVALSLVGAYSGQPRAKAPPAKMGEAEVEPGAAAMNPQKSARPPGPSLASKTIGGADHGTDIFVAYCAPCHGPRGTKGKENPGSEDKTVPVLNPLDPEFTSKNPQVFADKIDEVIQDGSIPPGPHPEQRMPAFGATNSMTQQQIADVEAYVMQLNGVARARIVRPGIEPRVFFWVVFVVFAVAVVGSSLIPVTGRR